MELIRLCFGIFGIKIYIFGYIQDVFDNSDKSLLEHLS